MGERSGEYKSRILNRLDSAMSPCQRVGWALLGSRIEHRLLRNTGFSLFSSSQVKIWICCGFPSDWGWHHSVSSHFFPSVPTKQSNVRKSIPLYIPPNAVLQVFRGLHRSLWPGKLNSETVLIHDEARLTWANHLRRRVRSTECCILSTEPC